MAKATNLDAEEQKLKIEKLQHELDIAKKPFWKSVGFWLTFMPVVIGVAAFLWDVSQDNLSQEAQVEKTQLEGQIQEAKETVAALSKQVGDLQTEQDTVSTQLETARGELETTISQLQDTRDELYRVEEEFERVSSEAVCTLGENVIENIAWLGTGLLIFASDATFPNGIARATKEAYPDLFQELGGDAFDRRMRRDWEHVWQDIPHYETIPDVAFATALVVGFVNQYIADVMGTTGFPDLVAGAAPRPTPLTLRAVVEHATRELESSGPAGEELARRLDEYELDPAIDSVNLMFFVDPAQVDLSFTSLTSKNWDDVTLTETETRIVVAEVQRLLDAHFQASREVSDLASSVLSGCPSR